MNMTTYRPTCPRVTILLLVLLSVGRAGAQNIHVGNNSGNGSGITLGADQPSAEEILRGAIARCEEYLARAEKHIRNANGYAARKELALAKTILLTDALQARYQEVYLALSALAEEQLNQADQAYADGDYPRALRQYQAVSNIFGPMKAGQSARLAIRQAEYDPACQAALSDFRAQQYETRIETLLWNHRRLQAQTPPPTAEPQTAPPEELSTQPSSQPAEPMQTTPPVPVAIVEILPASAIEPTSKADTTAMEDSAEMLPDAESSADADNRPRIEQIRELPTDKQLRAVALLERIVELYPDTPTGARAEKDLQAIAADADWAALLKEQARVQQAEQLYKKAELYWNAGLDEKADLYFRQIRADFPGTDAARRAEARLQHAPSEKRE